MTPPSPPLAIHPCRRVCRWGPTPAHREGIRVFACTGCGSQWVRTQPWAPVDADGQRPAAVDAEVTTALAEAEADSAGRHGWSGS